MWNSKQCFSSMQPSVVGSRESQTKFKTCFSKFPILLECVLHGTICTRVESLGPLEPLERSHFLLPKILDVWALVREFYANVDPYITITSPMQYKVFVQNKTVDISASSLNDFLSITYNKSTILIELNP